MRTTDLVAARVEQAGWRVTRLPTHRADRRSRHRRGPGGRAARRHGRAARSTDLTEDPWASTVAGRRPRLRPRRPHHGAGRRGARAGRAARARAAARPACGCCSSRPRRSCPGGARRVIERGRARRRRARLRSALRPGRRRRPGRAAAGAAHQRRRPPRGPADRHRRAHLAPAPHRGPHLRAGQGHHRAARAVLSRRIDPRAGVSVVWGIVHAGRRPTSSPPGGRSRARCGCSTRSAWAECRGLVREVVAQTSSRPTASPRRSTTSAACRRSSTTGVERRSWPQAVARVLGEAGQVVDPAEPRRRGLRLVPRPGPRRDGPARHPHTRRADVRPPPGQPARRRARRRHRRPRARRGGRARLATDRRRAAYPLR